MQQSITIYEPTSTDFSTNGLGVLTPSECTVSEIAGGLYDLELVHPIDEAGRWTLIGHNCCVKAPVPRRESPEDDLYTDDEGEPVTYTREVYQVHTPSGLPLILRTKPELNGGVALASYRNGTEVLLLEKTTSAWWKVSISEGGATGYMYAQYLELVTTYTETATEDGQSASRKGIQVMQEREQIFRIYSVEVDTARMCVTVKAFHAFYDLRANLINAECKYEATPVQQVINEAWEALSNEHPFQLYASRLQGDITADYTRKNAVEMLLDPDEGIVSQLGARIFRDNFNVFVLPDTERDMGVTIRRGKNLIGVTATIDASNVVTVIIPIGQTSDGEPLVGDPVISPIAGQYPLAYTLPITYDVKVGEGDIADEAAARAKLQELAEADFANGADLPRYTLDVDFVTLNEQTQDYSEYASLQAVHLYDTVTVIDNLVGISAKTRVVGYKWDVLAKRYAEVSLGYLGDVQTSIQSYQLPDASVTGRKIGNYAVGANNLANGAVNSLKVGLAAIQTAHIENAAITTAKIQDAAVDSAKIADAAITNAKIGQAAIQTANIHDAAITSAKIEDAAIIAAKIGQGAVTRAKIADAAVGTAQIADATITDAKIVSINADVITTGTLATDRLIIRGTDGIIYEINAQSGGLTPTQLADDKYKQYLNGSVIVARSVTAEQIKAESITAFEIAAGTITADRVQSGFGAALDLTGNSIYATVQTVENATQSVVDTVLNDIEPVIGNIERWMQFSSEGLRQGKDGSPYSTLIDETGYHIDKEGVLGHVGSFTAFGLETDGITIGEIRCKSTSTGGWVWVEV